MRKNKVVSAEEAVARIKDGDCITTSGTSLLPGKVLNALEVRFLTEGHPRGITWFDPFPTGVAGIEPLSHEGFLKRVIGGWYTPHPALREMIDQNKVEAYLYPLGSLGFWCQQMGAGRKGFLTQVGLETYLDPRQMGGRLNDITREEMVSLVQLNGEEYIWYKSFPINVAIIRTTAADEDGNLSMEEENSTLSILHQAMAAKRYGGTVIAQVKRVVPAGSIHPRMMVVPDMLVDCIVVEPEQHRAEANPDRDWLDQNAWHQRPPLPVLLSADAAVWRAWLEEGAVPSQGLDEILQYPAADKIAARRAALELQPGEVVNIGAGPSRSINPVAIEEEIDQDVELTSQGGVIGGITSGSGFRSNVRFYFDQPGIFGFYHAGLITTTYLGMLDFDRQGNVNNLRYGDTWVGPGGSMDIGHNARKIVFCGTFSAGGLRVEAKDGSLRVLQEGKVPRVLDRVPWVSFNGPKMHREGKDVLYVTERAVFRLTAQGPVLSEVAPGVDIERDVIGRMGFRPILAPDLKRMDERIFRKEPMGLKRAWTAPGG